MPPAGWQDGKSGREEISLPLLICATVAKRKVQLPFFIPPIAEISPALVVRFSTSSVQPSDTPQPGNFPTPPLRKLSEADRSTPSGGSVASLNRIPPKRRPAGAAQASAHELGKAGADGPAGSTTGRISRKEKLSPVLSSSHVLELVNTIRCLFGGKEPPSLRCRCL